MNTQPTTSTCEVCAEPTGLARARFCARHRAARRRKPAKWVSTPQLDALIREIYERRPDKKTLPGLRALAERIGWPYWALKHRAAKLGVARTQERPWSDEELGIVERHAWMSHERIALYLRKAGYQRSAIAVHLKIKRMRFKESAPFYTARGLAEAMGVNEHCIRRWIGEGRLQSRRRGSNRTESQHGDLYLIHENAVRRFIKEHPLAFNLRKVDQLWFIDLLCGGTTGVGASQ